MLRDLCFMLEPRLSDAGAYCCQKTDGQGLSKPHAPCSCRHAQVEEHKVLWLAAGGHSHSSPALNALQTRHFASANTPGSILHALLDTRHADGNLSCIDLERRTDLPVNLTSASAGPMLFHSSILANCIHMAGFLNLTTFPCSTFVAE